jgi:hypothetical protein
MTKRPRTAVAASVLMLTVLAIPLAHLQAAERTHPMRVGVIGLDTSHAVAFASLLNKPKAGGELAGLKIVAAYPGGSPDMPRSWNRVKGFTDAYRQMGIEIVGSIDELLKRVDAVLLESVDGRTHLAQAKLVIAARKPLFIDKPMAMTVADAKEIFRLAKENNVPCFSASSLRFGKQVQAVRNGTAGFGEVRGCTAWGPAGGTPPGSEPFWFHGIHGVEILFTIMGPGCKSVAWVAPDKVVGVWKDGRKGTFIVGKGYGATVEGSLRSGDTGKDEGYGALMDQIAIFFKTGKPPVDAAETLEILAFMDAADESKRQAGASVKIEDVMRRATSLAIPVPPLQGAGGNAAACEINDGA